MNKLLIFVILVSNLNMLKGMGSELANKNASLQDLYLKLEIVKKEQQLEQLRRCYWLLKKGPPPKQVMKIRAKFLKINSNKKNSLNAYRIQLVKSGPTKFTIQYTKRRTRTIKTAKNELY